MPETPPAVAPVIEPARWGPVAVAKDAAAPTEKLPAGRLVARYLVIAGLVAAYFVYTLVGRGLGLMLPNPAIWSFVVLACVLAWLVVKWVRRRLAVRRAGRTFPAWLDASVRLRMVGHAEQLERVMAMEPPGDVAFEPVVAYASMSLKLSRAANIVWTVVAIASAVLMETLRSAAGLPIPRAGFLTVAASVAIGGVVAVFIWPSYLRVVPGRIDILRYRLWSRRPTVEVIDVRGAAVLAHLEKRSVYLTLPSEPGMCRVIGLTGMPGAEEVVRAIFLAAISSSPTPPLPDDELVG